MCIYYIYPICVLRVVVIEWLGVCTHIIWLQFNYVICTHHEAHVIISVV